jgi:pimeloyl-ACP methyl ester carboxylesterase
VAAADRHARTRTADPEAHAMADPEPPAVVGTVRRTVHHDGVDLSVLDGGEGFPVVLAHGFPELAFSWRHQFPALTAAGCRVLAADGRGYGRTSAPAAVEDYDIVHLAGDLLALLDDIGEERAVFAGHDWGAIVVWHLAWAHPERVAGVVGMSVPFVPRGVLPPTQVMRQVMGDAFVYILYFQDPGVADGDLGRDPAATMRRMLCGLSAEGPGPGPSFLAADGRGFVERLPDPPGLPGWLGREELDAYVREFERTGFTGGINWYRNLDRNWELTGHLAGRKVEVPSLFVAGATDPVLTMTPPSTMDGWVTDHRGDVLIPGAGHWVQQEAAGAVNAALVDFVGSVRGGGR